MQISGTKTVRVAENLVLSNGDVSVALLLEAKKLVAEAGSVQKAEKALELWAKLSS